MKEKLEIQYIMSLNKAARQASRDRSQLMRTKSILENQLKNIEDSVSVEYTDWMAFFKKKDEGFEFLGFWNERSDDGLVPENWDFCLPMPKPETLTEFNGF